LPGGAGAQRRVATDYRDADLNFSFRLQQLTASKVTEGKTFGG
jgi:hypothetical protein